jgi:RNA polymerase sigma-70 factor (ECF subfamily)
MAEGQTDDPRVADARPAVDGLLARVARGDMEALGDLFDQVAGSVYGLVNRTVGDQGRSEQVTEEVLLEVWRTASRFSPSESSGLAWIIAIAQRRAHAAGRTVSRFGAPGEYG